MQLTAEQKQSARSWFKSKWKEGLQCPACGNLDWDVADVVFMLSELRHGFNVGSGAEVPVIVATCKNCGCVLNFNAIKAGVAEDRHRGW